MRKIIVVITALAAAFGSELSHSESEAHPGLRIQHDRAITLARDGNYAGALEILGALRVAQPEDATLLYDETVILAWAGNDADATANAANIDMSLAPDYVLDAVAKSYRNTGRYAEAIASYTILLDRNPENIEAILGLGFSHIDAGAIEAARDVFTNVPESVKDNPRLALAEASLFEREGRHIDALARYQALLETSPGSAPILRAMALVLRELLLPGKALAIAAAHPGILDDEEIAQLEADVAALAIREGSEARYPVERRYEGTERALEQITTLLAEPDLEPSVRQRLEYDRIVAFADRGWTSDAVSAFEALEDAPGELPVYLLERVATAYLDEHDPLEACLLLENAIERAPDDLELQFRLFFAYADLQDYDRADSLAEALLSEIAATRPASDPAYLRARILVGLSRAYADRLGEAQQYFESLAAEIPNNTEVRQELANVYRWRGWVDRSLGQYGQVLAVEPDFLSARLGEAHTLLDAREYDQAERILVDLERHYAAEPGVRNLSRRWQNHHRSEVRIDARFGESSGTTFGEDQYQIDASWYSRPLDNRYRLLARTHDAFAEFPEGDAHRSRAGLGINYRYAQWQATAAVTAERSGGDVGIDIGADYRYGDRLTFSGRIETESNATPLRGYRVGTSSTLASVSTRYQRDETTSISLTLSGQDLSDGNRARSLLLDGMRRVINRPRLKVAATAELYGSARSRDDGPYFSPRHDASWLAGFRTTWLTYRRYLLDFSQVLSLQAGRYNQASFPSGAIWTADYRLSLALNQRWYIDLGARRQRSFYDGSPEHGTWLIAGFGGSF